MTLDGEILIGRREYRERCEAIACPDWAFYELQKELLELQAETAPTLDEFTGLTERMMEGAA